MPRLPPICPALALSFASACAEKPPATPANPPGTASAAPAPTTPATLSPDAPSISADALHRLAIVVDTHNDVTQRLVIGDDLARRLPDGHTDLPRMRAGGLDAEFLSVWALPRMFPGDKAYEYALQQIDAIDALVAKNAASAVLARTASEVRAAAAAGKTAFLIGVEGGHCLGDAPDETLLERLRTLSGRGARYMTLTWSNSNRLGGSSGDDGRGRGLTDFGRHVIEVMNELGVIVDLSHVSDATFRDAIATTKRPVLASHSSSRALFDHPRNMTDDMLVAVRDNGGAVCVNFGVEFLDEEADQQWTQAMQKMGPEFPELMKTAGSFAAGVRAIRERMHEAARALPEVPGSRLVDHIEHIARVAGVDHVCLGSDFDGVPATPRGIDDVSRMGFITGALLQRGFSPDDVKKILGENVLRVLAANEPKK